MPYSRKISILIAAVTIATGVFLCNSYFATSAQTRLTYAEINVALITKLPNDSFKTRSQLIKWITLQVQNRKVDKPLTKDREDDLRQAGATEELIAAIRANSPALQAATPTPRNVVVDLGDLGGRAVDLVKPEYTLEARRAGTTGQVKLSLEIDTEGRVTVVTRVAVLPNGLTERAIEAARQSRFTPAKLDGKPARGSGILTYNFRLSVIDAAAVMATADDLRAGGNCDSAIAEYSRIIDVEPKFSKALIGRGICHMRKGKYDLSIADLGLAASENQSDPEAFLYLAAAYDFKGDALAAAEQYAKAIRIKPELDKRPLVKCLYIERQQMTPEQGRSAAGGIINACDKALRGAPEPLSSLVYVKRGIGYRLKSDYDKAIDDFETARRINPQFTAVQLQLHSSYNSRALLLFEKKDYKEAFSDISMAITMNPQGSTPYINRCVMYLYTWKQFDDAIADCSTAIRLSTKSPMAYVHRGYAYEMKNNLNAAISDYKKALEMDPGNQKARTSLTRVHQPGRNGKPY